ncbi:MAG: DNA internalization-related competence protein ComEC/Rec2 [Planctomycetota bacterium]|nr:DNA internalization-related competence protein ComEC/Rec2 [Planctomycetota bacterium]
MPPAIGLALLALALPALRRTTPSNKGLANKGFVLLLIATTGFARHHVPYRLDPPRLPLPGTRGTRTHLRAVGVICSPVRRIVQQYPFSPSRVVTRFDFDLMRMEGRGFRFRFQARLRVTVSDEVPARIRFGDRVELRGWFRNPSPPSNPGQRDISHALLCQGLAGILSVASRSDVILLAREEAPPLLIAIHRFRESSLALLEQRLSPRAATLLSCMLLGEREGIPASLREEFEQSGTLHILAISGLHVGLLVAFLWLALGGLQLPRRPSILGILLFLVLYATLTGLRPSVVRASLMIGLFLVGDVIGRRPDPLQCLAASAIVLVSLFPTDIHSPGFVLSYLAVLSIILFREPIASWLPGRLEGAATIPGVDWRDRLGERLRHLIRRMVAVSAAAWVGTAPVVLHLFHIVTPVVVLSNLIIIPLVWLLLVPGFLLLLIGPFFPPAGLIFIPIIEGSAWLISEAVGVLSDLPASYFYLHVPGPILIASWFVMIALILRRRLAAVVGSILLTTSLAVSLLMSGDSRALIVLDVGLGNTCIVRLPGGGTVVYDCGADRGFRPGRSLIAPALWAEGVTRIDVLILSHSHRDHLSGLPDLLELFPIRSIIVPPGFLSSINGERVAEMAARRSVPVLEAARGDKIVGLGPEVRIDVLGPPREPPSRLAPNDRSLVIRLQGLQQSILLTGDIEESGTRLLLAGDQDLRADIMTLPHHGSANPVTHQLIRAVRPSTAIVSTRDGFPDPGVLAAYRAAGVLVLSTTDSGAVTIREAGR